MKAAASKATAARVMEVEGMTEEEMGVGGVRGGMCKGVRAEADSIQENRSQENLPRSSGF